MTFLDWQVENNVTDFFPSKKLYLFVQFFLIFSMVLVLFCVKVAVAWYNLCANVPVSVSTGWPWCQTSVLSRFCQSFPEIRGSERISRWPSHRRRSSWVWPRPGWICVARGPTESDVTIRRRGSSSLRSSSSKPTSAGKTWHTHTQKYKTNKILITWYHIFDVLLIYAGFLLRDQTKSLYLSNFRLLEAVGQSEEAQRALVRYQRELQEHINLKATSLYIDEVTCAQLRESIVIHHFWTVSNRRALHVTVVSFTMQHLYEIKFEFCDIIFVVVWSKLGLKLVFLIDFDLICFHDYSGINPIL